jgi:putative membrane protein
MLGLVGIVVGGAATIGLVAWFGIGAIGHEVLKAGWVLPFTTALMFVQLYVSAVAWHISVGEARPRVSRYFRVRWIREAVNTLLPVAQLGGTILGAHLLVRRGLSAKLATAGTTLDVVIEAATQVLFILSGFAALASIDSNQASAPWIHWALASMVLVVLGFVLALRGGLLHVVEFLATRLSRWFPRLSLEGVRGLHHELMRLHSDRISLAKASALHLLAYILGIGETWMILTALGRPTALGEALVVESLGLAARSTGFAVPSGLGVQEAGFVLVGHMLGIPPEAAIALSMVKRARELLVGVPGLISWQWSEGRHRLRRHKARPAAASHDAVSPVAHPRQ